MLSARLYRWLLLAVLAVALAIRLGAGVWWQQRLPAGMRFGFPDSEGYWELGRAIAQGQPYEFGPEHYSIFRTPGYPLLLSGLFLLGGNDPPVLWARALSAILGTAAVAGVAALARLLFDEWAALVAAGIAAVYPEAIAASVFVLSEAPLCPLLMWQLVAWTKAWQAGQTGVRKSIRWSALAGVLAGLATLMRPSFLLFVPFVGAIGLLASMLVRTPPDSGRIGAPSRFVVIFCVSLAAMCLTLAPWWIRNYRVSGRFVPTTLQVGASLYDGLGPQATGASDMRFVPRFVAEQHAADVQPGAEKAEKHGGFEYRLDRRMRDASLAWTWEHPARALQLASVKLVRMWNPLPNATEFGSPPLRLVLALSYTPVIILAAIGVWRFAGRDWPFLLCLLPAIYFTCLHVVFVSSIRYREPAMLPLIVLAAGVVGEWTRRRMGQSEGGTDRRSDGEMQRPTRMA